MRIGYFIRNYVLRGSDGKPAISGGVKVISQHVKMLNEVGIEALLLTRNVQTNSDLKELNLYDRPVVLGKEEDLPDCDLYIGSVFNDVKMLFQRGKGKIAHLCQGYEPIDFASRVEEGVVTEKYSRKGLLSLWRHADRWKFRKRIREIESIYALPTVKAAISRHLVELIEKRYHQPCFFIQNGIDPNIFYPNRERIWGRDGKIKILSVGPLNVGFKGIPDTLQAIKILKKKGYQIDFIRVSPHPPSEREEVGKVVDEYHMNLKEQEMGEFYRNVDIFISSSLEGEGFGLPAMEALASGVPSVLTEISSYKNFNDQRDFAYFVPVHSPDRIADGVLALMEDQMLRERYQKRGLSVAKRFTLERTKEDLLNFIRNLNEWLI
jgi:glycosyltransferase involved in cell wall biosynthesis